MCSSAALGIERLRVRIPAEAVGEFSFPEHTLGQCVLTLVRCPFHPCVTEVARKRPRSFGQNCNGRLHLNTYTPSTQQSRSALTMLFSRSAETYQGNKLTRNSSECARPQSSSLTEPLWSEPGLKSGIGVRELISTETTTTTTTTKTRLE